LEVFLPVILAQRASASEKVLADPDQRVQLAGLLQSSSTLLQDAGPQYCKGSEASKSR
jgi:hypothetical protein